MLLTGCSKTPLTTVEQACSIPSQGKRPTFDEISGLPEGGGYREEIGEDKLDEVTWEGETTTDVRIEDAEDCKETS